MNNKDFVNCLATECPFCCVLRIGNAGNKPFSLPVQLLRNAVMLHFGRIDL